MTKANNIHSPSRSATSGATINQPRCGHAPGSGGLTYATRYRMLLELRARQRGRTNDFDELIDLANRAAPLVRLFIEMHFKSGAIQTRVGGSADTWRLVSIAIPFLR